LIEDKPSLFLSFEEAPSVFPQKVLVASYGKTIQFTFDPKQIGARDIFDFYVDFGFGPVIVDKATVTPMWSTLGYRVLIPIILTIPVTVLTYIPPRPIIYGAVQMAFVTGIIFYVISPLYKQAIVTLIRRHEIEMDLLVIISISMAYGFSIVVYIFQVLGRHFAESFWDTPTLLVTLIISGRWITT
jgi:Cd2+-exporting ATPase